MPVSFYDKKGKLQTVDDEFDPATGENLARNYLSQKYETGMMLVGTEASKLPGQSVFVPDVELKEALSSGKFLVAEAAAAKQQADDNYAKEKAKQLDTPLGMLESGARGFADSATLGFADEIAGGVSLLSGKGYNAGRDQYRKDDAIAKEVNTGSYYTGTGAAIVPQLLAGGSTLLGTGVKAAAKEAGAFGAASALGSSEADLTKGEYGKAALDTAVGGVVGGVAGAGLAALPGAVSKTVKVAGDVANSKWTTVAKDTAEGAYEAAKSNALLEFLPVPQAIKRPLMAAFGIKGGIKAFTASKKRMDELEGALQSEIVSQAFPGQAFKALAAEEKELVVEAVQENVRKIKAFKPEDFNKLNSAQAVGSGKQILEPGKANPLLNAGIEETFDSPINKWIAYNSTQVGPTARSPELVEKAFNMGTQRRSNATSFDAKASGRSMQSDWQSFYETFKKGRTDAYDKLQQQAANEFTGNKEIYGKIVNFRDEAGKAAENGYVPSRIHNAYETAVKTMELGGEVAPAKWGLSPGRFEDVSPVEQFKRLQKAREIMDTEAKWAKREGLSTGEEMAREGREALNEVLKSAPSKQAADDLYSRSKGIQKELFAALDFGKTGKIDEAKIARMLGDNDTANRFKSAMKKTQEFYREHGDSVGNLEIAERVLEATRAAQSLMKDKKVLNDLRYQDGPSAPAIKLLGYQMKKFELDKLAIQDPAGYLNMLDNGIKAYGQEVGLGSVKWLDRTMKKLSTYVKNNPDAPLSKVKEAAVRAGMPKEIIE